MSASGDRLSARAGVMATNMDAARGKSAAVAKGYWNDPFLADVQPQQQQRHQALQADSVAEERFLGGPTMRSAYSSYGGGCGGIFDSDDAGVGCAVGRGSRRRRGSSLGGISGGIPVISGQSSSPLMNRGYWSRVRAWRALLEEFFEHYSDDPNDMQVVSLGAGSDTLFFNLKKEGKIPDRCTYLELDLPPVVEQKLQAIGQSKLICESLLERVQIYTIEKRAEAAGYRLDCADLADIPSLDAAFTRSGVDRKLPTLFLSECVLVYLRPEESANLVSWLAQEFPHSAIADYVQIHPNDAFGQTMVHNLEQRGCPLLGLPGYPDEEALRRRFFEACSWKSAFSADMWSIYSCALRQLFPQEHRAVEAKEFLDEIEEFRLLQQHYCIVFGNSDHWKYRPKLLIAAGPDSSEQRPLLPRAD